MSGLAVTYMDGSQTQRIDLKPDITVKQTVEGITEGRDEVKEKSRLFILEHLFTEVLFVF